MSELRVGVVGCGYWGSNYLRLLLNRDDVVATAIDPSEQQRAVVERQFPGLRTCGDLDMALVELDAVIVCSPPKSHASVTRSALAAGCHSLVEKPFATSSVECHELVQVAHRKRLTLMVGHTYDYHPAIDELVAKTIAGEFGEIRYLDSARLSVGGYRDDVNVLWDMAPHDIVIMRRLLDAWPTHVSSWSIDHSGQGMPDVGMIRLQFENPETIGYVRVSWLDPVKVRRFTVVGSEQTAIFNDLADPRSPLRLIDTSDPRLGEGSIHPLPPAYDDSAISMPAVPNAEPLAAQLSHFLDCIRTGAVPRSSGEEGLRVVEILEAADRSAREGRLIRVGDHSMAPGAVA